MLSGFEYSKDGDSITPRSPQAFPSQSWTSPAVSASPSMRDAPIPSSAPLHLCWEVINTPETSWTACAFQCCPSSRYQSGLSPPWGAGQSSILSCPSLASRVTSLASLSQPTLPGEPVPTHGDSLGELSHRVSVIQMRSTSAAAHRPQTPPVCSQLLTFLLYDESLPPLCYCVSTRQCLLSCVPQFMLKHIHTFGSKLQNLNIV